MKKVSVMNIPCGFKIKSKIDADDFINKCIQKDSRFVLSIDDETQIIFAKDKENICKR